jgi:putative aldouronate transport system permease protein
MKVRNSKFFRELPLHVMLLPSLVLIFVYSYGAMMGVGIAFQRFMPTRGLFGSEWIGLRNFQTLFSLPDTWQVIGNTVFMSVFKMIGGVIAPVAFALLLNEISSRTARRIFQTMVYLPNFLSWVIISGIFIDILSPSRGIVNMLLGRLGVEPIFFLGNPKWFPFTMIVTDIWKGFGFGSVIYLAALAAIDPSLYESAVIDGANRWQQTLHITIPGIVSTIVLMTVLSMANILNGGFDQIFNMYSPAVYSTGDILDTMIYRRGIQNAQFAVSTAAGLFKSAISLIFIVVSYYLADKAAGYRIF